MKQELIQKQKLPEGWKINPFIEILILNDGGTWGKDGNAENGIAVLRSTNFNKNMTLNFEDIAYRKIDKGKILKKKLQFEDILLERSGGGPKQPVGRVVLFNKTEGTYLFGNFLQRLRVNKEIALPKYIFYQLYFKYLNGETESLQNNTTNLRNLRYDEFIVLPILLPPLQIQQQIVAKLDKQMAQVEVMKKEAEKEKETSEAYYESFTNNLIINSKYGTPFKISNVCKEDKKQIIATSEEARKRTYIGMEDVSSNSGIITINHSNQGEKILSNAFQFDNRHVLYGKLRPYLNKVALPSFPGRCSTELIPLLPKENCKREFLGLLLRTEKVIHAAMKNKTGSRMPRADIGEIMNVEFNLPSLEEQEKIINQFINFSKNYQILKDYENKILEAISLLPSSILNEVFGKYEIPDS